MRFSSDQRGKVDRQSLWDGRDALHPRPGVVFERRDPVETLRYSLDVFDARDNLVEVLGRVADLRVAQAAFEAAVAKHPDKRIFLRQMCRAIRNSDRSRLIGVSR